MGARRRRRGRARGRTGAATTVGRARLSVSLGLLGTSLVASRTWRLARSTGGMSLEDLLIAHKVVNWLLPDEFAALEELLERLPLPAPAGCSVPLLELRHLVAAEFGEECHAVRQLEALIL